MSERDVVAARAVEAANEAFYEHIIRPVEAGGVSPSELSPFIQEAFRAGFMIGVMWGTDVVLEIIEEKPKPKPKPGPGHGV